MIQAMHVFGDRFVACFSYVLVLNRSNLRHLRIVLFKNGGLACHPMRAKELGRRPRLAALQGGDFCQAAFVPLRAAELRR